MVLPPIVRPSAGRCTNFKANTLLLSKCLRRRSSGISVRRYDSELQGADQRLGQRKNILQKHTAVYPLPIFRHVEGFKPLPRTDGKILELNIKKDWKAAGPAAEHVPISARWLRDNCACKECRNQDTGQRQINVLKGQVDCTISRVEVLESGEQIIITFGDGHRTQYTRQQLIGKKSINTNHKRQGTIPITTWDAGIASHPPTVQFQTLQNEGLGPLLKDIRTFGFCFVDNMPPTPEATETLLAAIGPIRNTHYGGFYDFTADLSSKDTAYTSESLEPHTDNTYFTEPTGLQALHLLSHTEGSGGESSLVDGFGAAARLFEEDIYAYRRLSSTGVYAHASGNEGISIQPSQSFPVLSHDPREGHLTQVRWNNADRAGIECGFGSVDSWYDAATKFDALLSDPKNQYWFQLTPGKLLIFDNWRVLHGRAAFTGKRRMCGGYINRDDFISRYRMTNMSEEDIWASTVTG